MIEVEGRLQTVGEVFGVAPPPPPPRMLKLRSTRNMTKPTFVAAHGAMPEGRKKILSGIAKLCLTEESGLETP